MIEKEIDNMNKIKGITVIILCAIFIFHIITPVTVNAKDKKPAPVLNLRDINGKQVSSKELLTKGPAIIWFWNSCCGIKQKQLESLKSIYNTYKDQGLKIIAISEDGVKKTAKTKQAVKVKKIPFIVVMDKSKNLLGKFQAFAVPSIYLITQDGKIHFTHSGYMPGDEKKLEAALAPLFKKQEKESQEKKEKDTEKKEG